MNAEEIKAGIAAYSHEQSVMTRLLRKRGAFTERDFDTWLRGREWRRPIRMPPITGDTFLLGIGANGLNMWAQWLDLLQYMMALGLVKTSTEDGVIVYSLPASQSVVDVIKG